MLALWIVSWMPGSPRTLLQLTRLPGECGRGMALSLLRIQEQNVSEGNPFCRFHVLDPL
jgi:hypothetical protein